MTLTQLGDRLGVSRNAISAMENGKTYPPKATIEKLCDVFQLSPALFQLSVVEEGDFPEEKRILYSAMLEPLRNELLDKQ